MSLKHLLPAVALLPALDTKRTAIYQQGKVPEALETLAALKKDFPDAKFEASEKAARIRNTQY